MYKIVVSLVLAFVVGFISSRFLSKPSRTDNSNSGTVTECKDLALAKSSLISISQNEYLEYTQIKDLKQKYEKADELLGKIMLLFLADVGFKTQKAVAVEPMAGGAEVAALAPPTASESGSTEASRPAVPAAVNSTLAGKSSLIKMLPSEKRIDEALEKAIIENPKVETAKGGALTQKQVRLLEGRYAGSVKFLDGKRENLSVTWDLMPDYTKSDLSGTFRFSIHGPGKNSETNSNGFISNIVNLAEDQDGILVNACGEECYFQLYYNTPADQFFGNYYELRKGSKAKFERLGLVDLKK